MFSEENNQIEVCIKVIFTVTNFDKASTLKPFYSWDGDIVGLEDSNGNIYSPLLAFEEISSSEAPVVLSTDNQLAEKLGLEATVYSAVEISEPYTPE